MGILTGVVIHRTGRYIEIIWIGTIFMILGFGLLINRKAQSTLREIVPFEIVAGIGSRLLFEPPLIALQTLVLQEDIATATATFGFIRNIGLVLSIVIDSVVFQNGISLRAPQLCASGVPRNITDQFSGGAAAANVTVISTLQNPAQKLVVKEAFARSLRNMWILFTNAAVYGIVATAFVTKQVLGREHTETKTGPKKEKEVEARCKRIEYREPARCRRSPWMNRSCDFQNRPFVLQGTHSCYLDSNGYTPIPFHPGARLSQKLVAFHQMVLSGTVFAVDRLLLSQRSAHWSRS